MNKPENVKKDKPVILVVDDQPQSIELFEAYLVPQGYEIITAANGEEALGKLSGNQIDLIMMDVMMPGMDGFEVTRRIRQDNAHRLLPIILVTVLRETEDRIKGIEAGCDDFISKPVDKVELLARVRSLLKVRAYNDLMSNYQKELESEVTIRTEELRRASIFQQVLIDVLPVPVFYMDSEGRYLGCNNSFEKLLGQKREQTNGKSVYELFPKELADIYHEKNLVLLQNPGIQTYETTIKDGMGVDHNVIYHKATFPNTDGSVGGLIGAILDITDLKLAEKALRVSEEKYRVVVENAKEAIIVTQDMNVVFVNNAGVDMIKYSEKILKPKPFTDFIHPDDINMVVDHHIRRLKGEGVQSVYSFRLLSPDGTVKWVELNAAVIKWNERPAILSFLKDITGRKLAEASLQQTLDSLQKAVGATIQVMVSAVEMRDPYTAGHQLRVANLACAIATEMGLPQDKIDGIRMAGSIHDIGKLSIPAEILSKPTKLTNNEFALIKEHPLSGYEMLKDVESPWPLAQVVYQHHERMDGSGYPRNLKGDEIIMEARIMAVADVVEAMASHRPYRAGLGIDAALAEIEKNKGTHYDNTVVDACLRLFREKGYQLT